jgi:DNA invertase Pin-like site-specific DNA recombinase
MKAIAYVRVSTDKQQQVGAGLDLQMVRIEEYARNAEFKILKTFRDVHTAVGETSIFEREGIQRALAYSKEHGVPIIVDGLDRISRRTETLEQFIRDGRVKIISAKSGEGASSAVISAEVKRAQAEAERISRTTRLGLERAKRNGKALGNPRIAEAQRLGQEGNRAAADARANDLAHTIEEIRAQGHRTKAAIAGELNRRGFRTARGKHWDEGNIRRVLQRVDGLSANTSIKPLWGSW